MTTLYLLKWVCAEEWEYCDGELGLYASLEAAEKAGERYLRDLDCGRYETEVIPMELKGKLL